MITADTITDEQIRELRGTVTAELHAGGWPPLQGYDASARLTYAQRQCDVALGVKRARKGSSKADARVRCAEILNARACGFGVDGGECTSCESTRKAGDS